MLECQELKQLRLSILSSLYKRETGHLGGSLSCLEFLILVYTKLSNNTQMVMSKGHASLGLYTVLDWIRNSDDPILNHYGKKSDGRFHGHISKKADQSIALSCGSLGHGFPFALGLAVANTYSNLDKWTICLMGDGEIQEGTTWESMLLMSKFKSNIKLLVAIDSNNSQQTYNNLQTNLIARFGERAKISTITCEGNDIKELGKAFDKIIDRGEATILILETTKGNGIPSIQGKEKWHAGKISNEIELQAMADELMNYREGKTI